MSNMNRRDFLKLSTNLAVLFGLGATAVPKIVKALEELTTGNVPVLWLQGLSCSGCSVSFLNSDAPGTAQLITQNMSLLFHSTLSTATGDFAMNIVNDSIDRGGYFLVVEGAIPAGMPKACKMGHKPIGELVLKAAGNANAVIAVGSCASFGGVPAAENNSTGAVSIRKYLESHGVNKTPIILPGCPCHPDWLVGTLVHVLKFGMPALDGKNRPSMFYSKRIHDQCPRFADYEREFFAKSFTDEGCLFKLGCLGVRTYADCTIRSWNSGMNNCIKAGAPCLGCSSEEFASKASFPFFLKGVEDHSRNEKL